MHKIKFKRLEKCTNDVILNLVITMLYRKITKKIEEWYENSNTGLLVDGARQIGKTTSILEFLKKNNLNYIDLNLVQNKLVLDAFNSSYDEKQLILRLSALSNKPLVENETVIFIDEIQKAEDAITPIKFLVQNTKFRFIFSGSLLGIKMQDILSIPVGFLTVFQMFPMDFEEYCIALNVSNKTISYLQDCFDKEISVDSIIHKQMLSLFDTYLVVGGMPKAVQKFIESNDIYNVNQVLYDIDLGYKHDIVKYQNESKLLIQKIYDLIPSELNAHNKRFILKNLNQKARFFQYESSFAWLKNSGVGLFVHNVDNPIYPLLASKERTLFKLFLCDVGLLSYKLFNGNQAAILNGNTTLNNGAIYEAVVAQELSAHNFQLFYNNDKKRGEIDFLIEYENQVIPIEVKSGKDYKRHSALSALMSNKDFNYKKAYVLCNGNIEKKENITYLPIYMISFIKNDKINKNQIVKLDISKLI